jgi:hypothetical protein
LGKLALEPRHHLSPSRMSLSARNYDNYGQQSSRSFGKKSSVVDLQKSIREQKILLSALLDSTGGAPVAIDTDIESLKRRIATVDKQIHGADSRLNTSKPELLLSRYSSRMRQLSDMADHQRSMRKEIDFTLNTTIKDLEKQILRETEKLNQKEQELARIRDSKASGSTNTSLYNPSMTEADRIRSKAQAMIAARLNKTSYVESTGAESKKVELAIEERDRQLQREVAKIDDLRNDLRKALASSIEASDLERNEKQLKEQRMFEDGLFVSEELSDFIDSLRRDRARKAGEQRSLNGIGKYGPPPATPPLPRQYSPAPPPLPASKSLRTPSSRPAAPPPVPTSLRPETPRSAEAIKAEAHRRIDEKRMSLQTFQPMTPPTDTTQESQLEDAHYKQQLLEAEKAAQAKLREAERQAQIRLADFNKRKEEAETSRLAAEEEERRLKQEAERKALEEEQERLKRERVELEKKKKAEEEQRLIQEKLEKERQRIEQEKQKIEREEKEARERQKKLEEETRAAEKAKEEEAERLRRAQEELERAKEAEAARRRELEAAESERQRLLEVERQRLEAEKAAAERRRQEAEELDRQRKAAAAAEEEEQQKLAAAEDEKKQQMIEHAKEEGVWSTDLNREERRTRNSTDFSQAKHFPTSFSFDSRPSPLAKETSDDESESEYATESESEPEMPETNTTAGTAGFGTDLDDEVDFRTSEFIVVVYNMHELTLLY